MIFRLSQKLARKIKVVPKVPLPTDDNPFADWSAHVFTVSRAKYVILTNTASLYSVVMYGKGIVGDGEFVEAALSHLREFMCRDGNEFVFRRFIAPASGKVLFSKASSRSVIGSMNDLVACAKTFMREDGMSPFDAASALNDMPMSVLQYRTPREAFGAMNAEPPTPTTEVSE
jgi:hypothetical protein